MWVTALHCTAPTGPPSDLRLTLCGTQFVHKEKSEGSFNKNKDCPEQNVKIYRSAVERCSKDARN